MIILNLPVPVRVKIHYTLVDVCYLFIFPESCFSDVDLSADVRNHFQANQSESELAFEVNTSSVQGAVAALKRALENQPGEEALGPASLNCVYKLACINEKIRQILGTSGVCELLVSVLVLNFQSAISCEFGLRAIFTLSQNECKFSCYAINAPHKLLYFLNIFYLLSF